MFDTSLSCKNGTSVYFCCEILDPPLRRSLVVKGRLTSPITTYRISLAFLVKVAFWRFLNRSNKIFRRSHKVLLMTNGPPYDLQKIPKGSLTDGKRFPKDYQKTSQETFYFSQWKKLQHMLQVNNYCDRTSWSRGKNKLKKNPIDYPEINSSEQPRSNSKVKEASLLCTYVVK